MYNANIASFKYVPLNTYKLPVKNISFAGNSRKGTLYSVCRRKHGRYLSSGQKKSLFKKTCILISGIIIAGLLAKGGSVKGSIKNIGIDNLIPETKISESGEFKFDKIKLEGFTDYMTTTPVAESTDKSIKKNIADKVNKLIAPDASAEIEAIKGKSYIEKNVRLKKLYKDNEYNPQLKNYLLSCRMDYINKNFKPEWAKLINENCEEYNLNTPEFKLTILSQFLQESALNPKAVSTVGAYGLPQILPKTMTSINKTYHNVNNKDPLISLDRDLDYKKIPDAIKACHIVWIEDIRLFGKYPDSEEKLLAAYNAGTGAVIKNKGIPPYEETQLYVKYVVDTKDYMQEHLDDLDSTLKANLGIK
ncbi:MAG: lytic transglycosylase domain-containing protein [Candidatus Gastranaerophilales bacterium]|nr:lytic transglycosylase domain-containing protein [Candidatus Gastranaerophilales bacterium]